MVHFSLRLRENMYAEWRDDYVDYDRLKRLLLKQQQRDEQQLHERYQQQQYHQYQPFEDAVPAADAQQEPPAQEQVEQHIQQQPRPPALEIDPDLEQQQDRLQPLLAGESPASAARLSIASSASSGSSGSTGTSRTSMRLSSLVDVDESVADVTDANSTPRMSDLSDQQWQPMVTTTEGTEGGTASSKPIAGMRASLVRLSSAVVSRARRSGSISSIGSLSSAVMARARRARSSSSLSGGRGERNTLLSATGMGGGDSVSFEEALEFEYDKVERAYSRLSAQFADHLSLLRGQYRADASAATRESLKRALVELHRLLHHLENFALLNYTGFVKILKKHDKWQRLHSGVINPDNSPLFKSHDARLNAFSFAKALRCRELLAEVETLFADRFCDGDRAVALATLLTKREIIVNWAHIYLGMKVGACLLLLVWVGWDSLIVPTFRSERERHVIDLVLTRAYPVYRGIGGLLLLHWLLGVSLYVWRSARINYRYIFELDPRRHRDSSLLTMSYPDVLGDATNMTIVFLVNVLLYYKVVNGYFPEEMLARGYYPLALAAYTLYFYLSRAWRTGFLRTLWEIVASPLYAVTFFHTFVGDYLTSTVKVTQDLAWSVCFFSSGEYLLKDQPPSSFSSDHGGLKDLLSGVGVDEDDGSCQNNVYFVNVVVPLVCALPLWWRFLQSLRRVYDTQTWWPNLPNAGKYALTQVVALFGLFHPLHHASSVEDDPAALQQRAFLVFWLFLFTASSLYTWIWDVTMDWGLGRPQYKFLGDSQMFSRKWVYYAAMVADLFLRFSWTLTLIPPRSSRDWLPRYVAPATMVLELFRRTFWSFFRLENEHLRNTQGFRRVDFIPLHYDHGVGADEDDEDAKQIIEPLEFKVFVAKILGVTLVVLALSVAAIVVEKD
jgi:hypothetical protein